eukprot:scaffold241701_cov30-Tisochrysis_lutea.AAC.2
MEYNCHALRRTRGIGSHKPPRACAPLWRGWGAKACAEPLRSDPSLQSCAGFAVRPRGHRSRSKD